MPQALLFPLHCAQAEEGFTAAVEASIVTGGCTSSRASIAGACHGALATDTCVPEEWVHKTAKGEQILRLVAQLLALRAKL